MDEPDSASARSSKTYVAGVFDNINRLAAISLTEEAFGRYRGYREWLIADDQDAEQVIVMLASYLWDVWERPPFRALH